MLVTRVAYSNGLNRDKYQRLEQQAVRLGHVRSRVWRQYGSVAGAGVQDRTVRDRWMSDGTARAFGTLATPWKETLRDAIGDITANREAAKVKVRRAISRRNLPSEDKRRLYQVLKRDEWADDKYLSRLMRQHHRRGQNRTMNQIVVRSDNYRTFTLRDGGDVWLSVPGLEPGHPVRIPLNTTHAPTGTLRLILRDGRVEVHCAVDGSTLRSSRRPVGTGRLGVDKGYTEALTSSDGNRHGTRLGSLLSSESDYRKVKNQRRSRLRAIAEKAEQRGDHAKADRIRRQNLGTVKRDLRSAAWERRVRDIIFNAVHEVVDEANIVVAEDLTRTFASRRRFGRNYNRRMAAWTRGVTAEALASVSERRGSVLRLVNAAYTSQVIPFTSTLGVRKGDRLHCTLCGAVWEADHAAAINVEQRDGDPDISLFTPHIRVKQILLERDRLRSKLPDQDSSAACQCGERNIR